MNFASREKAIEAIEKEKLIAILRGVPKDKLIPLAEALYRGGVRALEVTFSHGAGCNPEETAEMIKLLTYSMGDRMHIGAGTVLTAREVELTKEAGGSFIISPNRDRAVIERTRELSMVSIPGALTPSEVVEAHSYGADFVKLFPVSTLGAEYVKAVRAPLPHTKLLAVGGINETNVGEYLKAGVCGFGVGSNIIDKKALDSGDFDAITRLSKKYVMAVK